MDGLTGAPTATEVVEAQLFDVNLPLDGQDMAKYGPEISDVARDKILNLVWAYAPVGMERTLERPVELQRIIRDKAVRNTFSTFEVGVKLYAVAAGLPIPFVRELLTFVSEATNREP